MDNPRSDKVAVVDEVRERLSESSASVVTEYRGLTVAAMAELRRTLRASGGDFKVFKNTLVRRAIEGGDHAGLADHLTGPTAITFVSGDVSAVAKALKDFAKANPELIIKGGVLEGKPLTDKELKALADLPSREVLLSQLAGLIASPMQQLAGLFKPGLRPQGPHRHQARRGCRPGRRGRGRCRGRCSCRGRPGRGGRSRGRRRGGC